MDPLTTPLSDPIIMPPVPPPQHRSHLKLEIIAGIILVIIVAIAVAFSFGNSWLKTSQRVSLVGTATTTVYTLSGTTLTFVSAVPTENHLGENLGTGHALGTLPDGSLLALTPTGLSVVKEDGATFQIVNAGGTGSTTPLGVAALDLSVVALENQVTHAIDVYQFNPVTFVVTYIGSATGIKALHIDTSSGAAELKLMKAVASTEKTLKTITKPSDALRIKLEEQLQQQKDELTRKTFATSYPQSIAITDKKLLVIESSGAVFSYGLSGDKLGEPATLEIIGAK